MPRFRFDHPWRVFWKISTSNLLLVTVLLALASALLFAAWLPQVQVGGTTTDVGWQAKVQRRFGDVEWFDTLRPLLEAAGVFDVFDAAWFRVLLALLAFCLLARLADAIEALIRGWREKGPPSDAVWQPVETSWDAWAQQRRLRTVAMDEADNGEGASEWLARVDRWPWAEMGPILVYLGGLLVLVGLAFTDAQGWQSGPLPAVAGERVALQRGRERAFLLTELSPDGRRGAGELWRDLDSRTGAGELAVGRPLVSDGVSVHLVGSGAGLRVRATLSETRVLELATGPDREARQELVVVFAADELRHLVAAPEADLALLLSLDELEDEHAAPHVQVFELGSGQLITEQDVSADTELTVADVSFNLDLVPYAQIRGVYDPGAWWSGLGFVALMLGLGVWKWRPPGRVWVRQRSGAVEATGDVALLVDDWVPGGDKG